MITATAITSIGTFIFALWLSGVVRVASSVMGTARDALGVMHDESIDEMVRERAVQRASLRLMGAFTSILLRGALAFLASLVPIWIADLAGLAGIDEVTKYLSRWDVIVAATGLIVAGYVFWTRLWTSK